LSTPHFLLQTFTEELVRFPSCFLCYTPSTDAPPVAPLPALAAGYVTFGSFNALAKQTGDVLELWAALLRR
jgi:predicted O-linked N-acetylglucosamine transferase (SPINDLY family)